MDLRGWIPVRRIDALWRRHGRTFWILHSCWALATGIAVLWLAHERYDFVYWVVGFLALTWGSTLYFGSGSAGREEDGLASRFGRGLASYLTRVLYQETLFFLLPFYAYSAVVPSWNLVFVALLALLAVLSCLDLVFDRWLRESPVFGLVFFTAVTFGALNLLLPMMFALDPSIATPVAAGTALVTAVPLALRGHTSGAGSWLRFGSASAALLAVAWWFPNLVPPAPLRLQEVTFAADLDPSSLKPTRRFQDEVSVGETEGRLVVLAEVFAPSAMSAKIALDWYLDDSLLRSSREVEILAHEGGFRFWDALQPEEGILAPGKYRVVVRTADDRVFGSARIRLR